MIDTSTSDDTASNIEDIGQNDGLDIVAGLVVAFLSVIAIFWLIPTETETVESDYDVSAAFFPYLAGWATLGLSFLLVLSRMATMACQRFFPMTVSISPWPIRLLSSTTSGCSSMLVAP